MRFLAIAAVVVAMAGSSFAADAPQPEAGFVSLFDGKTLNGWKVGQNADMFQVRDGVIVMQCPATTQTPAHMFYVGKVGNHDFKNFHLKVDVMTFPKANSGIYFHTKYQESGWPSSGVECQVNNSHVDWRRTGSLWALKNISWGPETPPKNNKEAVIILPKPLVTDNVWYTEEVICQDGQITVKLNGKTVLEYTVSQADIQHKIPNNTGTWLPRGTFALQGHPPMPGQISRACFKNIRVKILPD
jgi:hypothetical protein